MRGMASEHGCSSDAEKQSEGESFISAMISLTSTASSSMGVAAGARRSLSTATDGRHLARRLGSSA